MRKIKLTEKDLEKIVNRVVSESKSTKKNTIVVSEEQLVESIERIISEMMHGSTSLGFGNTGGMGMGFKDAIIKPSDKYNELDEKEDLELDIVDDPDATEDGMGMFESGKKMPRKKITKKNSLSESIISDVDGITDSLLKMYKDGMNRRDDLNMVDARVYSLLKKTTSEHNMDSETKKNLYVTLGKKLKNTEIPELISFGRGYSYMGNNL